ncbi:hypothetical protein GDO86_009939 [Hymenochirus boettgeri]|uniref:Uncharacterized protein n=1 Tax=Hymenochirus boettgeri TaxID=247094 RepID=A0A8T2JQZ2_9PIPI|nr:hypothetical protein GDO86_009939 [Hymenochirus boettgeri]
MRSSEISWRSQHKHFTLESLMVFGIETSMFDHAVQCSTLNLCFCTDSSKYGGLVQSSVGFWNSEANLLTILVSKRPSPVSSKPVIHRRICIEDVNVKKVSLPFCLYWLDRGDLSSAP